MKFTFRITNKTTGEVEKFVTESGSSEVDWHIALKVLGYMLYFERRPEIEQDVGQHYRPDLFAWDEYHQNVSLWIDCGNIAVKKIDKVATKMGKSGKFVILRRTEQDAKNLFDRIQRIKHPERVSIISFAPEFVDKVAGLLDRTNDVEFEVYGVEDFRSFETMAMRLTINGQELSSDIIDVAGRYGCKF